jgi:adenylate kinase
MKVIIVTGTPGTGKTFVAKKIAAKHKFLHIDVTDLIKSNKLSDGYDKKHQSLIVDTEKLNQFLVSIIRESKNQKGIVIDSHLSHYLPPKYVDACIVTKCDLKVLQRRLIKRGYSAKKIRENLDCEIFDLCLTEAIEQGYKPIIIDTSKNVILPRL